MSARVLALTTLLLAGAAAAGEGDLPDDPASRTELVNAQIDHLGERMTHALEADLERRVERSLTTRRDAWVVAAPPAKPAATTCTVVGDAVLRCRPIGPRGDPRTTYPAAPAAPAEGPP